MPASPHTAKDFAIVALLFGVPLALVVALDASFYSGVAVVLLAVLAVPTFVVAVVSAAFAAERGARTAAATSAARRIGAGILCFFGVQVLGIAAGHYVTEVRVSDAKEWCEAIAVKLDDWHREHGSYPATLEAATWLNVRPTLCDQDGFYYSVHDGQYSMHFYTERGFDSAWRFSSNERTWIFSS